ncbi:hypothetical protein E4U21_003423, partial [Claviceps maximensis]
AIVEGDPPDLPKEGYSDTAQGFVSSCLHKIPKMRATYAMLLSHPWLQAFSKPQTIKEETEEGEEADKIAEAVGHVKLGGGDTADEEVAEWLRGVLAGNKDKSAKSADASRPALHAVPLDTSKDYIMSWVIPKPFNADPHELPGYLDYHSLLGGKDVG